MKLCIVIPFYNHAGAIGRTIEGLRPHGPACWLVNDGSEASCRETLDRIAQDERGWVRVLHCSPNAGKGHAVMTGFRTAFEQGYTHALQIDADGQHDPADVPRLVELARRHPDAVITGIPVYDDTVPRARLYGRYLTHVWVWINTLSFRIRDSMCGFRVYPLAPALAVWAEEPVGRRMDFDTEILVRLFWRGMDVLSLPTRVRYPLDGVSHFDLWRDNLRISRMHTRLFFGMLRRLPRLLVRRRAGSAGEGSGMKREAEVLVEIPFHDCDPANIVWHGHYLKYFEIARCALLETFDFNYPQMMASGYFWPVIDVALRYVRPAVFGQKIRVRATLLEWEHRLKVGYLITDAQSGQRMTKGSTVQVAVDRATGEMCLASPDILLERLGLK